VSWAPFYEAVKEFFSRSRWAGAHVPVVYASPDRAHAEIRRVQADREAGRVGISKTPQALEDRPVPVPFMSITITPPRFNRALYNPGRQKIAVDLKSGAALVARTPHPVTADVQVEMWCGSQGGELIAQSLEPQVEMAFFGGAVALPIDWAQAKWYRPPFNVAEHLKHYGQSRITLYTDGWQDTSDLEAGEGQKETRRTWSGRINAMVPFKPEEARIIRTIEFALTAIDTDEDLGSFTSGTED
jgi:hypothetical protein